MPLPVGTIDPGRPLSVLPRRVEGKARPDRSRTWRLVEELYPSEMLTVARARWRLIRLLGSQEFSQHPVITGLAHRQCQFASVETNDLAAPTAFDHGRRRLFRFHQCIFKQNCHRDSFGTQASRLPPSGTQVSCLLSSTTTGGTPAYRITTLPVSDSFP